MSESTTAETIYFGGPIVTMVDDRREVEAIAVADGRILAQVVRAPAPVPARLRVLLRLAAGDAPGAARVLEGAGSQWPGDADLRGALGRLAVEAPAAVPAALAGALAERGDWADQLNLALGAAKAGDAAGCAAAADWPRRRGRVCRGA